MTTLPKTPYLPNTLTSYFAYTHERDNDVISTQLRIFATHHRCSSIVVGQVLLSEWEIKYFPLCRVVAGLTEDQSILGVEFSGKLISSGRRVMGIADGSTLATRTRVHKTMYLDIPDEWSLKDAATVPMAYCTAYAALVAFANVGKDDKVLIHAGSGAVGLACCVVASHKGAEVFCTVSSEEKKKFVMDFCPAVSSDHVFDSRSISFERDVMRATQGQGVDIVVNSLAGPLLQASIRCLAVGGRFVEIGKADILQRTQLSMEHFDKAITVAAVNVIDYMWNPKYQRVFQSWKKLVIEGIASGVVRPLPSIVFDVADSSNAIR